MPGQAGPTPTLAVATARPGAPVEGDDARQSSASAWQAAFLFLGIAVVLFAVGGLALTHLAYTGTDLHRHLFPGRPWLEAWVHWDGGWYGEIADRGYWSFVPSQQGPMAFFPAYPLLMRLGRAVVGNSMLAGIMLTVGAGATAAGLFFTWLRERVSATAAWTALLLFLLYPFAYYLYGAVYADAVFIAATIGSFLLVERDHPWLAGLVGAVATAARPVGFVLVVALVVRVVERRGGLRRVPWRDAGVLLAAAGIGAFCLYGWIRFGAPLAFVDAQKGWNQTPGVATWLKFQFWKDVRDFRSPFAWVVFVSHPILTLSALALVPRVVRRFGWSYGLFALLGLGISAVSTKNYFGMSRYVLSAFPCFAVAGELLVEHATRLVRTAILCASGAVLVAATAFFATGHYLS
jgi:hypothetical protein